MIPTLFVISLVIFGVLNLAPGKPGGGAVSSEGTESSTSSEARESYRIFKEQFNFDKPTFFNTRYALTTDEVRGHLLVLADYARPACPEEGEKVEGCIPAAQKPPSSAIIESQDLIEDWGSYTVPHLLDIAQNDERVDIRRLAINRLSVNAKRRLINEYGKKQSDEQRAQNKEISAENERVGSWKLDTEATAEDVDAILAEKWVPWAEENKDRWTYSFGDKVGIFFGDTRFAKYWGNLMRFDFGVSHVDKRPVLDTIAEKLPYTLTMNLLAILIAYMLSIPLGVWSAYYQNTLADQVLTVVLFALYSLPSFFVGVLLLNFFTVGAPFDWFPTGGFVGAFPEWYEPAREIQSSDDMTVLQYLGSASYHLVLPVFCMCYGALASLSRYARTGLLDVIRADYIRTARAKGLAEPMVIIKHAVRNGMIPILTLLGTLMPALIGGSVVIEVIFNIPGMGLYMFESIFARDYNAIMGVLLISTLLTLVGLLISDISYAVVDPRISFD